MHPFLSDQYNISNRWVKDSHKKYCTARAQAVPYYQPLHIDTVTVVTEVCIKTNNWRLWFTSFVRIHRLCLNLMHACELFFKMNRLQFQPSVQIHRFTPTRVDYFLGSELLPWYLICLMFLVTHPFRCTPLATPYVFCTEHANLFPKPSHPPFFLRFPKKSGSALPPSPQPPGYFTYECRSWM